MGLEPGEATFADAKTTKKILGPIAREIITKRVTVTVAGTTALPEEDPTHPLSNARARAV